MYHITNIKNFICPAFPLFLDSHKRLKCKDFTKDSEKLEYFAEFGVFQSIFLLETVLGSNSEWNYVL